MRVVHSLLTAFYGTDEVSALTPKQRAQIMDKHKWPTLPYMSNTSDGLVV